jgi:peptidoglycan/LPS O-acetylase OafA/YrhL
LKTQAGHPRGVPGLALIRPGEYLPLLDGWRGVAICMVLLFHAVWTTTLDMSGAPNLAIECADRLGTLGVLIFFSISGYLITGKLVSEAQTHGTFSGRNFYVKRIFRILPPAFAYLLVLVVLDKLHLITLVHGDWGAVFFYANYVRTSFVTSHFWSLSVEEHFYLLWPICLLLAGWRRSLWVGCAVIVAVGVYRPWALPHVINPADALRQTEMRMDYIMMGCVVALAVGFYPWAGRALQRLGSPLWLLLVGCLLAALTVHLPIDARSFQAACITLIVCASAHSTSRVVGFLLGNPVIRYVGKISYSLYIWQQVVFFCDLKRYTSPGLLPLKFVIVALLALGSYYGIERPFIRLGRRFLQRPRPRASLVPPQTSPGSDLPAQVQG